MCSNSQEWLNGQGELAAMAKELRALSYLDGKDEFARYADPTSMTREEWIEAVARPPRTTTQVNVQRGLDDCYTPTGVVRLFVQIF